MDIQLIQEILTYIIIAVAVYVAVYKMVMALGSTKKGAGKCSTECSGCSAVDMKKKHSAYHDFISPGKS
jgi:large-conductance mechanosensitive channel